MDELEKYRQYCMSEDLDGDDDQKSDEYYKQKVMEESQKLSFDYRSHISELLGEGSKKDKSKVYGIEHIQIDSSANYKPIYDLIKRDDNSTLRMYLRNEFKTQQDAVYTLSNSLPINHKSLKIYMPPAFYAILRRSTKCLQLMIELGVSPTIRCDYYIKCLKLTGYTKSVIMGWRGIHQNKYTEKQGLVPKEFNESLISYAFRQDIRTKFSYNMSEVIISSYDISIRNKSINAKNEVLRKIVPGTKNMSDPFYAGQDYFKELNVFDGDNVYSAIKDKFLLIDVLNMALVIRNNNIKAIKLFNKIISCVDVSDGLLIESAKCANQYTFYYRKLDLINKSASISSDVSAMEKITHESNEEALDRFEEMAMRRMLGMDVRIVMEENKASNESIYGMSLPSSHKTDQVNVYGFGPYIAVDMVHRMIGFSSGKEFKEWCSFISSSIDSFVKNNMRKELIKLISTGLLPIVNTPVFHYIVFACCTNGPKGVDFIQYVCEHISQNLLTKALDTYFVLRDDTFCSKCKIISNKNILIHGLQPSHVSQLMFNISICDILAKYHAVMTSKIYIMRDSNQENEIPSVKSSVLSAIEGYMFDIKFHKNDVDLSKEAKMTDYLRPFYNKNSIPKMADRMNDILLLD